MTDTPTLLFLHGVGNGDPGGLWRGALETSLPEVGYPDLSEVRVIAPWYADLLHGVDDELKVPAITVKKLPKEQARSHRREFEQRVAAMEQMLGRHAGGRFVRPVNTVVDLAVGAPGFEQARRYLSDQSVRAHVLTRILDELPESGKLVIVGHSLGSVIAADLVRRLPEHIEVNGLVTVGSPLANDNFNVDKLREELHDPPANLAWWVNLWSASDPVAALRGVSSVFPWLLDKRVDTTSVPGPSHSAREYLNAPAVATAIGYGLFGSRSREIVLASRGVDLALDPQELTGLLALRYAHLIGRRMRGEASARFCGALRLVQADAIAEIELRAEENNRPVSPGIRDLRVDLTESSGFPPVPPAMRHLSADDAVVQLVTLAENNPLAPFDITIGEKTRKSALEDLAAGMGLGSSFGTSVIDSLEEAAGALQGKRKISWVKWGLVGIGAMALAIATGGLALAASPGLAGAAAITSALAGFGPGGMIGGLLTAGTLVSAGTTGIAVGVLSPATSAESVEALVKSQLAVVIMRSRQHLEYDPSIWFALVETERVLRRERSRLGEFSDPKSEVIVELDKKLATVTAALAHLVRNNLTPVDHPESVASIMSTTGS